MQGSQILVEWLSHGSGRGSFAELTQALETVGILKKDMEQQTLLSVRHSSLRDLSDCSILDFGEGGGWQVQPTRVAMIKQDANFVRAVVCGARDCRVHLALSSLSTQSRTEPLGRFGVQVVGPPEELSNWAQVYGLTIESHWIAIQVQEALDQLGATSSRRASAPREPLPRPIVKEGPFEVRRLSNNFRRETVSVVPSPHLGAVLEVVEPYTSRRVRYVGTSQGWLKVPYAWAPWVCAAGNGANLAQMIGGNSISVPLWARLPEGLSRAVTLSSGIPWQESGGRLVSGPIPPALLYNLKRILSLG